MNPAFARASAMGETTHSCAVGSEARSKSAQARLKVSAAALARSRGTLRTSDPERAVHEWKGLIAARWTLLDVCEEDGSKYLIARENQARVPGPDVLTEREREVVAFAVAGHHNKLIAYNLGISPSTVRVLMSRAAKKLRAHSREELIRRLSPGGVRRSNSGASSPSPLSRQAMGLAKALLTE
jgi:DNA-binding CsgD family transcriptional regulator